MLLVCANAVPLETGASAKTIAPAADIASARLTDRLVSLCV